MSREESLTGARRFEMLAAMKHHLPEDDFAAVSGRPAKRQVTENDGLHCFGMLVDFACRIIASDNVLDGPIALDIAEDCFTVVHARTGTTFGWLEPASHKMMVVFQRELTVQLFADCISEQPLGCTTDSTGRNVTTKAGVRVPKARNFIGLCVVLYGLPSLFEAVGQFTAICNLFLQHPRHCNRNVPYRNPHCLSPETTEPVYTHDMSRKLHNESEDAIQDYQNPIDLFADSAEQEDLAVTHSPRALRTELYKHQKQALTFMLLREKGWALKSEQRKDIWKAETDATGRRVFKNTISGQKQVKPPEDFRGGLLIDAPGLGKSLSIISLILSTKANSGWKGPADAPLAATLLIAPKTLIQTWKDELQRHLKSTDDLRFCVYYGKDRTKLLKELHRHDLVITTYSVVRLDWKASSAEPENRSTLYSVKWRRIVLDEAHIIREPTKSFARSVCALKAECRWGVTGTPIQNRLTDLYSLFKFLRCTPFDDVSVFNAHVTKNWRARSDPNSVAKLKTLVNCLSLRRPKTTVTLPARRDTAVPLEFNEQERKHYDKVKTSTKHKLASVCHENRSVTLMNALQWVNELRHICTMGIKDRGAIQTLEEKARSKPAWNQAAAQTRFDIFDEAGLARCSECSQDLASSLSSETDVEHVEEPRMEEFLDLLCSSCFLARSGARNFVKVCNHLPRCPVQSTTVQAAPSSLFSGFYRGRDVPTKIQRLVQDLCETPKGIRSVVFSGWTTTFDIIQPQLIDKGIRCVRLDGTSSASHRSRVIHAFRMNTDISVLLATITCGGVGLDLTAASRAYIMEPQWNPMSESQALDRIHRLGQQKEVETIRYVMRESYEEQVLKLQKRKQELADLTLSGGLIRKADLTEGRLRYLKELVG